MALRFDDIDYFLAVAQHHQVRRAAVELGVSQPALTKAIQRLELELGFPLFVRSRRGMELTGVAAHFHGRMLALRRGMVDAIKESADLHLGEVGTVRVGVSPLYARQLFVPAVTQLHIERPAATVSVQTQLADGLLRALRAGELDLSINVVPSERPADLDCTPLMDDDLWLIVRDGHPLLARRQLRLADLANVRWMLPSPAVPARRVLDGLMAQAGLAPPRVVMEYNNSAPQMLDLVRRSDMVSVMSELTLRSPDGVGLSRLQVSGSRLRRCIGVIALRQTRLSPLALRLREILVANSQPYLAQ